MSVTIPSLNDVTDILDTDMVMVTQSGGQTYKISGADLNKRNQAVIASSTTLTGAPLKTGNIVRAYFTADITGVNTTTALSLSYNGSSKTVKVPKDGALVNFTAQNMGGDPVVYKYLQAYTTLELLYDGTNFVIIGNPVVISSSDYTIFADGLKRVDAVTSGDKGMVTSDAVDSAILDRRCLSIPSPAGSTKYYKLINNSFSKVSNVYLSNKYLTSLFIFSLASSSKSDILRLTPASIDYGIKGIKLGTETINSSNCGVAYIKVGNYNPVNIMPLNKDEYELIQVTETDWNNADNITNYNGYPDIKDSPCVNIVYNS